MKLIIDMPDNVYARFLKDDFDLGDFETTRSVIRNGKPLQAEFEKIRAEITACTQQEEGEVPACINYGIKLSTEIVEKHIAELKVENKQTDIPVNPYKLSELKGE